jgi:uncharacterized protein (TIGR03086 family)
MPSPSDQIKYQTEALHTLVQGVKPNQWGNPTPCAKWTVRDLTSHLVGGGHMFAASFRGDVAEIEPGADTPDMLGDDPVGAVDGMVAAFAAAADTPGAMERDIVLPFATLPAQIALNVAKFDILVHCWDLAQATNQKFDPPADIVAEGMQMAEMLISPEARDGDTFADPCDVSAGASAMDELAAFAGHRA